MKMEVKVEHTEVLGEVELHSSRRVVVLETCSPVPKLVVTVNHIVLKGSKINRI